VASEVPIPLSPPQYEVYSSDVRFRVLVAGRRMGTTFLACVELMRAATTGSRRDAWYVAPTYRMAKEIAWRELRHLLPRPWVRGVNETDLSIQLANGSRLALRGADNPDSLRGVGLDFAVFDEFAWISPSAWEDVLRPALSDREGRALFITSPAGHNWAYDLYLRGKDPDHPSWKSWQFTTLDGGRVSAEEIEEARRSADPRIFRQEYEASFETLQGRVYSNFIRDAHTDASVKDTNAELLVGMDFNVNPMSAVIAVRAGDECHILDALSVPVSNTEEMAQELKRRYPGRRIIVCPDPSGSARKTSAPVGQTDFTILQRAGFEVRAPSQAPLVVDRINNTQAMLQDASGRQRVRVHPRAHALLRSWDGLTYKAGTSIPDKTLKVENVELIHIADAADYMLWQEFNLMRAPVHITTYRI